jgi:hypothetical protein
MPLMNASNMQPVKSAWISSLTTTLQMFSLIHPKLMLVDLIAVGAMFPSPMLMGAEVLDALISVMTHSIVVTNMILLSALQVGLAMKSMENASWLTQVMDLVPNLSAKTTANHIQDQTNTDAIPLVIHVTNAKMVIPDAAQTELLNVTIAKIQMLISCSNVTKPILKTLNAKNVLTPKIQLIAMQSHKNAQAAIHLHNSSCVTRRHSNANNLIKPEVILRPPVMQAAITSLHPNF